MDALSKYNHVFRLIRPDLTYNDIVQAEVNKIYAYAERNGIENVWFLGDLAERPRMTQEAHALWLRNMCDPSKKHFRTRGIIGNHDFEDIKFHSMQALQGVLDSGAFPHIQFHYGSAAMEMIDGVRVGFLPYPFKNAPRSKAKHDQAPRVYLGHFDVKGAKRDNGRDIESGADEELDTGDSWIIGHIHTFQTPRKNVILPGTLYQLNMGETLPKGFLDVSFRYEGDKLMRKYEWIENEPTFTMQNVVIETVSDFDKVSEDPSHLTKLFVKKGVELPGSLLRSRPNIVNNLTFKDEADLVDTMRMEVSIETGDGGAISFNEAEQLSIMLAGRGLNPKQIERGFELLRHAKVM